MPVSDELRDRRLFVTLALERAAVRSGHREGAKAEKREEAGKAPAGEKLPGQPPRQR